MQKNMAKKSKAILYAEQYYKDGEDYFSKSRSTQKMWNYFLYITEKDHYKKTISQLREKYGIPENGFKTGRVFSSPPKGFTEYKKLHKEVADIICRKYHLHLADYAEVISEYILHNYLQPVSYYEACGLFLVSDILSDKEEGENSFTESDDIAYPIAIRISPYASQRDLIDYVTNKTVWKKEIEFLQKKYRDNTIKIGKIKRKNKTIQDRNLFIYQNRDKSIKEIRKLLAQKKIYLDDGHISKIISLENRKRKDV